MNNIEYLNVSNFCPSFKPYVWLVRGSYLRLFKTGFHPEIFPRGGKIRYNGKLEGHVLCTLDLVKYTSAVLTHVMTSSTVIQCTIKVEFVHIIGHLGVLLCNITHLHSSLKQQGGSEYKYRSLKWGSVGCLIFITPKSVYIWNMGYGGYNPI